MKPEKGYYNELWQAKAALERDTLSEREMVALNVIRPGFLLVDLGCGDGLFSKKIKNRFSFVVGCELSLTAARKAVEKRIPVILADLNDVAIPIREGQADWVTALDVIEHVFDPEHLIQEIFRILKKGGHAVIATPNIRQLNRIASLFCRGEFPKTSGDTFGWDGGHLHYFTSTDLFCLLEKHGLTPVHSVGIYHAGRYGWLKRFLYRILPDRLFREFIAAGILVVARKVEQE